VNIPEHIAIIMDGNGRWAKSRGLPRVEGHRQGVNAVRKVVRRCAEYNVKTLTLFAYSTENNKRCEEEIGWLFKLFLITLKLEVGKLNKANIQLKVIGDLTVFNNKLQKAIKEGVDMLSSNTGMTLVIAANYSGQWDLTQGAKKLAQAVEAGSLSSAEINEEALESSLSLGSNQIDLLIRSSGEYRVSNFMLWHLAYSELYFTDTLWPDFDEDDLEGALAAYQGRDRRFGSRKEDGAV